jgi:hypothetical protein
MRTARAKQNLTNRDGLPACGAFIVALPMKITGGQARRSARSRCCRSVVDRRGLSADGRPEADLHNRSS